MRTLPIRLAAAALLLGFLAGMVHMLSFPIQHMLVRAEVKRAIVRGLPEEELVQLAFSAKEFAALDRKDDGREFALNGAMYDIVRMRKNVDGSVEVVAFMDEEETQLTLAIERAVARELEEDPLGDDAVASVLMLGSWSDGQHSLWDAPLVAGSIQWFAVGEKDLLIGRGLDWSPPPRA